MYAVRRTYISQWEGQPPEDEYEFSIKRGGKAISVIDTKKISYVEEEVMYWRKANQIHGWFDANIPGGVENCERYRVPLDTLRRLLDVCQTVLKASELVDGEVYAGTVYSKDHPEGQVRTEPGKVIKDPTVAKDLLPTTTGFFFGSQEYDEWYIRDVEATRDWLLRLFDETAQGASDHILYFASW